MSKRQSVIHKLPQIIARDGGEWMCHYCGSKLIPLDAPTGTEPYYQLVMVRAAHPATSGDCEGRYTYEEVMRAIELSIGGELMHWVVYWTHAPGYRSPFADHVVPYSKGGSHHIDNLVAACYECNQEKRAKSYDEFVALKRAVQS